MLSARCACHSWCRSGPTSRALACGGAVQGGTQVACGVCGVCATPSEPPRGPRTVDGAAHHLRRRGYRRGWIWNLPAHRDRSVSGGGVSHGVTERPPRTPVANRPRPPHRLDPATPTPTDCLYTAPTGAAGAWGPRRHSGHAARHRSSGVDPRHRPFRRRPVPPQRVGLREVVE